METIPCSGKQSLNHIVEALLDLRTLSASLDEEAFMQRGQELAEDLTASVIAFIHFINDDEQTIQLINWSRRTLQEYCHAAFEDHYPVEKAGIWAEALRQRAPVVVNDYDAYEGKHGLPEGHAPLKRFISVPVFDNGKVVMLAGVGNKATPYTDQDVETVQLLCNEIWYFVKDRRQKERLQASQKRYEALFHALGDAVLVHPYKQEGFQTFVQVNRAACEQFGYEEEALLARDGTALFPPETAQEIGSKAWRSEIKEKGKKFYYAPMVRKDGETFPAEIQTKYFKLGEHPMLLSIVRDITKRLETERQLQRRVKTESTLSTISRLFAEAVSKEELDRAVNTSLALLGTLHQVSRAYLFRYDKTGNTMSNTHEWCASGVLSEIDNNQNLSLEVFEWWRSELEKHRKICINDADALPPSAEAEKASLKRQHIRALFVTGVYANDALVGFLGFDNVTEATPWREEDQSILQLCSEIIGGALERFEVREQNRTVLQKLEESQRVARLGHYTIDMKTNTWACSAMLEEIFGAKEKRVKTRERWMALVDPMYQSEVQRAFSKALAHGYPFDMEYPIIQENSGARLWVRELSEFVMDEHGACEQMFGTVQDVTDHVRMRKHLKDQEELLVAQSRHAAMGEMISMIAHQWRQPLSVIAMDANMILADLELGEINEEELENTANDLLKQSQHLSQTIDDFKDFFKPNKAVEKANVCDLIEDVHGMLEKSFEFHGIALEVVCDRALVIETYAKELVQVLINLMKNAKEAIMAHEEEGWVRIEVVQEKGRVHIRVLDSGGGIAPSHKEHIFDPYFTTKESQNGTGLGLYMSKTIVEKHLKGTIRVANHAKGAVFEIELPEKLKGERHD